jgi:hypothetical protein
MDSLKTRFLRPSIVKPDQHEHGSFCIEGFCEKLPACGEMKREILHAELRWVQIELKREYQLGPSSSRKAGLHRVNRAIPPGGGITRFVFYENKLVRVR